MEVTDGGEETLLSVVRPYGIGVPQNGSLNKSKIHI